MTEYKEVPIYGTIMAGPNKDVYFLINPRPEKLDNWLQDDERCFLVCPFEIGTLDKQLYKDKVLIARYIIIRGDYLLDFALAGRRVKIQVQEVTPLDKLDEEIERQTAERVAVAPV